MAVLVALSLVFVVLGAAMAASGSVLGWIAVVFFGLGGLACLLFLIRPYRLVLTPDGFDYVVPPHSPRSHTWAECGPFRLVTVSRTRIMVFATSRTDHKGMRGMNRALTGGADANLQAHFRGISPDDLVELMNRYRDHAMRRTGTAG